MTIQENRKPADAQPQGLRRRRRDHIFDFIISCENLDTLPKRSEIRRRSDACSA